MTGNFARSKAGHDKGKVYVIIAEDDEYVYLADGDLRKTDHPKKKKKKHVQLIYNKEQPEIKNQNEAVRKAIKEYKLKSKEDSQCQKRM